MSNINTEDFTPNEKTQIEQQKNIHAEAFSELEGAQVAPPPPPPRDRGAEEKQRQEREQAAAEEPKKEEETKPSKPTNPILLELHQVFGLEQIKPHDETIKTQHGKMAFTLKPISKAMLSWANSTALEFCIDQQDYINKVRAAIVAASVSHINKVPIHQVFDVTAKGTHKDMMASAALFDFMNNESRDSLSTKLYNAYDKYIEPESTLLSNLDVVRKDFKTYTCSACGWSALEPEGTYYCYRCHESPVEDKDGNKVVPCKVMDVREDQSPLA